MTYLIGLHEQVEDMWWSEHQKTWTPNVFAATGYAETEATLLVVQMKKQGVDAFTEMRMVSCRRYMGEHEEKATG